MVEMLEVLKALGTRIMDIKADLDAGHEDHETGVAIFNQSISTAYTSVTMAANGMRGADWQRGDSKRGSPNWARIVFCFSNRTRNPITVMGFTVLFDRPTHVVQYEDVAWEYAGTGGKIVMTPGPGNAYSGGQMASIDVGRKLAVTMLLKVSYDAWLSDPYWHAIIGASITDNVSGATSTITQEVEFS
jgi:hypothetical protein